VGLKSEENVKRYFEEEKKVQRGEGCPIRSGKKVLKPETLQRKRGEKISEKKAPQRKEKGSRRKRPARKSRTEYFCGLLTRPNSGAAGWKGSPQLKKKKQHRK